MFSETKIKTVIHVCEAKSKVLHDCSIDIMHQSATIIVLICREDESDRECFCPGCGVIYAINQYNGKSTTINFAYDAKTSEHCREPNI